MLFLRHLLKDTMNKKNTIHVIPLIFVTALAMIIGVRYLNEPPAYIHAWSQADNYSLAIGFTHNGGDLFHPQTLIYNKQQKGYDDPLSLVTACDFPLHHWVAGSLMSLTGTTQPWVFRGLTLLVAILGLWALYLLAFVLTNSRTKALLASAITATAPSFAYYSSSFLPTVPSLSFAIGGLLLYALHIQRDKLWMLYASILLLTLAMMTRASFAVPWVAVACFHILRLFRKEARLRTTWQPFFAGALLFAAWWLWNAHLRQEYGSLFLASLLPVKSIEEAKYVLQNVHDRWRFHYFQRVHHWLFVLAAAGALAVGLMKRKGIWQKTGKLSLWWLMAIWLFGELLFVMAMSRQFCDHDYYFLDSLFLPIVITLVGLLGLLPNPTQGWSRLMMAIAVAFLSVVMTDEACHMQQVRRSEGVEAFQTAVRYKHANQMLETAGLNSRDLRFLTLFSYPQNTPFVMMDREGYAVMWTDPEVVSHALTFDYDYILVEDEVYRREFEKAPFQVLPRLKRIGGNGEISVCTLEDSVLHPTAEHFFESAK